MDAAGKDGATSADARERSYWDEYMFVRTMAGMNFQVGEVNRFSVNYFVGAVNGADRWTWIGGPLIQLTINLKADWKYVPAKIYSF